MTGRLWVLGSLNLDLTLRVPRRPRAGETVLADSLRRSVGGKGLNQAVAATRLGARTLLIGRVGDDEAGRRILSWMRSNGIADAGVGRVDQPTGGAWITVDEAGENSIVVLPGANATLRPEDVDAVAVEPDDIVLAQLEVPVPTIARFFTRARAAGACTILNAAPFHGGAAALTALTDVLVVNETEWLELTGAPFDHVTAAPGPAGVATPTVVVTLGRRGAALLADERVTVVPAPDVVAVDTTGAGDCFTGALAASLLSGHPVDRALALAVRAAAWSVRHAGGADAMPCVSDLSSPSPAPAPTA